MKRLFYTTASMLILLLVLSTRPASAQLEPFIGQVSLFGFNFCPRGWAAADGQLLDIASNSALFSLFGTIYGGDGRTTFALPDLRGRAPVHVGQGPGLSNYIEGQKGGVETVTLVSNEMPVHNHALTELSNQNGNTPGIVVRNGGGAQLTPTTDAGGGAAHENRAPYLVMRYCVALEGIFPSRN